MITKKSECLFLFLAFLNRMIFPERVFSAAKQLDIHRKTVHPLSYLSWQMDGRCYTSFNSYPCPSFNKVIGMSDNFLFSGLRYDTRGETA